MNKEEKTAEVVKLKKDIELICSKALQISEKDFSEVYYAYQDIYERCLGLSANNFNDEFEYTMFHKYFETGNQHKMELEWLRKGSNLVTRNNYFQITSSLEKILDFVHFMTKSQSER